MKSRILKTVGLIAAMVSCIGMTAFAAPSPAASTVVTAVSSATDTDGNAVNVSITSEIPIEYTQAVADIKTEAKLKEVIGDFNANMTVADVKEVTAPEGAKFPLKITFVMKGVTASSKVQILHYNRSASAWEKIDTTVADGTVTGTFSSLSPVAFVVDKTTLTSATGTATSPATSATAVSAVAVLGLAAVAAVFGLKKKAVR
jgi:hypothetical protein